MDTWMVVVGVVVLATPLGLMFTLARGRLADSRGRKRSTRWSARAGVGRL